MATWWSQLARICILSLLHYISEIKQQIRWRGGITRSLAALSIAVVLSTTSHACTNPAETTSTNTSTKWVQFAPDVEEANVMVKLFAVGENRWTTKTSRERTLYNRLLEMDIVSIYKSSQRILDTYPSISLKRVQFVKHF
ncbi:hypothetical protein Y032_0004g1978 [Ancylostoma ceylanicum]|uniref:Uncharacterized protein n=1 Tax=Ancylostoma ceylanicum TaxID=53326 RepID=A0A016VU81_9BILA|nr:hypothetical protein Y032_0004g1978 [Ancylostoma ceylanicum]